MTEGPGRPTKPGLEALLDIVPCVGLPASWCQGWARGPSCHLPVHYPPPPGPLPFGSGSNRGPVCFSLTPVSQLSNLTGFALIFERGDPSPSMATDSLTCMKIQHLLIQDLLPHRRFQFGKSLCKQERKAIS